MRSFLMFFVMIFISMYAFGEEVVAKAAEVVEKAIVTVPVEVVPSYTEIIEAITALFKGWGGMSAPVIASSIIVIVIMLLKTNLFAGIFNKLGAISKRCILGLLGIISSILLSIGSGITLPKALWGGLIIGGGAVLIFELVISLLPDAQSKLKTILGWIKALVEKISGKQSNEIK